MEKPSNSKGVVDDTMSSTHAKMIAIRNELEIIRRAVTCSICLCTMKEPITLAGCAHSFCYTCIRQSMEGGGKQSKCPLCQLPTTRRSIQKPSNVGANSVRILIASYKQMVRSFGCAPIQYTPSIHTLTQLEPMEEENDTDNDDAEERARDSPAPATYQDIYDQWHVSRAMLKALKDQRQAESKVGTSVVTEQIINEQEQIVQVNEECYLSRHRERDSPKASPMVTSFRPQRQSLGSVHRTPLTQKKLPPSMDSILLEKSPHTLTQILQQAQSQEAANQRTPSPTPDEDHFYSAIDRPPLSMSPMKKQPPQRTSLVPLDEESASSDATSQGVLSATSPRRKSVSEILQQEEEDDDDDRSAASSASDLPPAAFQADPNRSRSKSPVAATISAPDMTLLNDPSEAKPSKSNEVDVPNYSSFSKTCVSNAVNHTAAQDDREEGVDALMAVNSEDAWCGSENDIECPNADATNPAALQIGDIVQVQARTWPGINQLGGIAKILKVHSSQEGVRYDVRYVLDRRKECNIQECYVSLQTEINQATKEDVPPGTRRRSTVAFQKENDVAAEAIPPLLRKQLIADGCDLYGTIDTIQALDHFKKSKTVAKRFREPEGRESPSRKRPNTGPAMPMRNVEEACLAAEERYRQRIETALAKGILYVCTSSLSEREQRALQQMCQILQKGGEGKRAVPGYSLWKMNSTDVHSLAFYGRTNQAIG
jgi:Zinc finger, C3HC4 type (RING finger)